LSRSHFQLRDRPERWWSDWRETRSIIAHFWLWFPRLDVRQDNELWLATWRNLSDPSFRQFNWSYSATSQ
jgi:hypothetical protein